MPFTLQGPTFDTVSRGLDHMLSWISVCKVSLEMRGGGLDSKTTITPENWQELLKKDTVTVPLECEAQSNTRKDAEATVSKMMLDLLTRDVLPFLGMDAAKTANEATAAAEPAHCEKTARCEHQKIQFDPSENHRGRLEALAVKYPTIIQKVKFHQPTSTGPSHSPVWTCKCSVKFYLSSDLPPETVSHTVTDIRKRFAEANAAHSVYEQCIARLKNS
jgi:hypothetical protein